MFSLYKVEVLGGLTRTAEIFGINLRARRKEMKLTQADIANALKIKGFKLSGPTVSQWESGKYLPDSKLIDIVIDFLGTDPGSMFSDPATPRHKKAPPTLEEALKLLNDNRDKFHLASGGSVKSS